MADDPPGSDAPAVDDAPAWFRGALDAMLDLVAIDRAVRVDGVIVDFEIVYMNPVNIDVAGRPHAELIGARVLDVYPAAGPLVAMYADVVETGEPLTIDEYPYEDVIDGKVVSGYYAMQATRYRDGVLIVSRDVTEQRRVYAQLARMVERFEAVEELTNLGVWTLDLATNEVWFSSQMRRIFGMSPEAPVPTRDDLVALFFGEGDQGTIDAAQAQMEHMEEPVEFEVTVLRPDGTTRELLAHGEVVKRDGVPVELWGGAQDVTEHRRAERALGTARTELHEQHLVVEELQSAILPGMPAVDGLALDARYIPAAGPGRVGGDWYDVFVLPSGGVGLVVGDVAGHGLPAAAAMAQLRNALRAHAFAADDPAATLSKLNHYATRSGIDVLATVLYAVIDLDLRTLRWARAGHLPPLVRSADATVVLEGPGRPPIGVEHDNEFPLNETVLSADALIVLYTDGLVERRRRPIDDGIELLRHVVEAGSMEAVAARLDAIVDSDRSEDDTCFLVARLDRRVGGPSATR